MCRNTLNFSQIIQQNTNKTIKTTCGDIEKLNSIVKLSPPDDKSYRLMLEKIVSQFDDNVKKYLQSEKSLSMRMKKAVLVPVHEEDNAEQDVDISQQQQLIRSSGLELVIDQESQFLKLETDIADIHSVMQNLSSMVYEQAEIVTSIEDSVNDTDHDVAAATKDLESAVVLNQKSRKMKLIIIIVVLVVVLIVGIIIYKVLIK